MLRASTPNAVEWAADPSQKRPTDRDGIHVSCTEGIDASLSTILVDSAEFL